MHGLQQERAVSVCALMLLVPLAVHSGHALAREDSVVIPEQPHARMHGSGWECDRGYRPVSGAAAGPEPPVSRPGNDHVKENGNNRENKTTGHDPERNEGGEITKESIREPPGPRPGAVVTRGSGFGISRRGAI
jgi:hypothetical protein